MRRIAGAVAVLVLAGTAPLVAQYFGQNKVQYRTFDFQIIQTEHFEVYYYPAERVAALDAARMAERWYARLSRVLHHEFQGRKPIILYASQSDFQQTNVVDASGEGLGGVTEFFKHRMVLPFTGSYAELEHVIGHEMVHQFQYDVFSRGRIGAGVQTLINVNPPLWFMEGMAEYLSLGPIDNHTAMWLRDASLEGHLPTIEQLTYDPRIFPYYFGHALWAYIGEKWSDEVIGEILQGSTASGVEGAFKRALGLSLDDLSSEWRDAVQTTYLPQLAEHYRARRIAQPVLTRKRSDGTLHIAPALSPDGRDIAYFSERKSFFVDLYLADAETGRVKRRLTKATLSNNYESLRFINSAGSFSPDGRYFAIAAKHNDKDDLVILDVKKDEEVRRITVPLNGLITPAWSPDGKQLVFTGFDGGLSDLFVVNADGTDLRRLTNDKYADLHPAWSPDGKTIAFATDRGPATDFGALRFGNMRIALYHLENGAIETLPRMEHGKNINPAWAPDGRSIAFVSDRTGISNIYLYDLGDHNLYQLTDLFTGAEAFTPLSPVLSWARQADRMAFAYYEEGEYNVYAVDNPRSLRRQPFQEPAVPPVTSLLAATRRDTVRSATPAAEVTSIEQPRAAASVYRSPTGFRASNTSPQKVDSGTTATPVSVRTLLDSATTLPDTSEFTFKAYHTRFTPDYVARPTIGYERNNFGRGFFGGTAISLSDMLGNHTLVFAGAVNGRLSEAQVLAIHQPGAPPELGRRRYPAAVLLLPAHHGGECRTRHVHPHRGHPALRDPGRLRRDVLPVQPVQPRGARCARGEHHRRGAPAAIPRGSERHYLRAVRPPDHQQPVDLVRVAFVGAGARQFPVRLRRSVRRLPLPLAGEPELRRLAVCRRARGLATLFLRPAVHVRVPRSVLRPLRTQRRRVPRVSRDHRAAARLYGGLAHQQRMREFHYDDDRSDRLLRARPVDRLEDRGGRGGAAVPAHPQPGAGIPAGGAAPDRGRDLLRHGAGLGVRLGHQVAPRRGSGSGGVPPAAAELGRIDSRQLPGVRRGALRLHQATRPAQQQGVLDGEPRPNVLTPYR